MRLTTAKEEFLADCRLRLQPSTITAYASDLDLLVGLAKVNGADSVISFTPELVRRYFLALSDRPAPAKALSMATLHRRRASVSQFANWCVLRRLIADNPMRETASIRRPKKLPRPFTDEVQDKIRALELATPEERVIRALLFDAGLRVSEVCTLRVLDVEWGRGDADGHVRVHGKGNKDRVVPLTSDLWHVLYDYALSTARLEQPKGFLIAQPNGRPYTRRMISKRTRKWGKAAEVTEKVTPHRFRHTFGTELVKRGADLRQVQELMGHEDINTTAIYTEVAATRLRSAVNLLARPSTEQVLRPDSLPPATESPS